MRKSQEEQESRVQSELEGEETGKRGQLDGDRFGNLCVLTVIQPGVSTTSDAPGTVGSRKGQFSVRASERAELRTNSTPWTMRLPCSSPTAETPPTAEPSRLVHN